MNLTQQTIRPKDELLEPNKKLTTSQVSTYMYNSQTHKDSEPFSTCYSRIGYWAVWSWPNVFRINFHLSTVNGYLSQFVMVILTRPHKITLKIMTSLWKHNMCFITWDQCWFGPIMINLLTAIVICGQTANDYHCYFVNNSSYQC